MREFSATASPRPATFCRIGKVMAMSSWFPSARSAEGSVATRTKLSNQVKFQPELRPFQSVKARTAPDASGYSIARMYSARAGNTNHTGTRKRDDRTSRVFFLPDESRGWTSVAVSATRADDS
jgi:hypothetical protein